MKLACGGADPPNQSAKFAVLEGGVLIAVTEHPHLERALSAVLEMIDRSRSAVP